MPIINVVAPIAKELTQSALQGRIRLLFQLVSGILRVLQKLPKFFNGTTISTFLILPSAGVFLIFALNLNNTKFMFYH